MKSGFEEGDPWEMSQERLQRLDELSPSAKLVYIVLRAAGTLDQDEIMERTRLPKRTVRYALDKLVDADLVSEEPSVADARRRLYRARTVGTNETD